MSRFFLASDYDVRKSHNARWIDQKCTPDVLSIVSDCIVNMTTNNLNDFTSSDVWNYEYTKSEVALIFQKPNLDDEKAKHEYDKFFQQPLELLSYSGVVSKSSNGRKNTYRVSNRDLLSFISLSDKNALFFLVSYIEKVLTDSGIFEDFSSFFSRNIESQYRKLKERFSNFTIDNTPINTVIECNRIFAKVLNPLCFIRGLRGSEKGKISRDRLTYDQIMYNRMNFRDEISKKPKDITRVEHSLKIDFLSNDPLLRYQTNRAKRLVREWNTLNNYGHSEVHDPKHLRDEATQMHHIFPVYQFPSLSFYPENIIALTPTQHFSDAHNNNTQAINLFFQEICINSKIAAVQNSITNPFSIYSFENLLYVLSVGLGNKNLMQITENDFPSLYVEVHKMFWK